MDTIWNCAFGLDIDLQNNRDNSYFRNCERLFSDTASWNLPRYLGSKLKLKNVLENLTMYNYKAYLLHDL